MSKRELKNAVCVVTGAASGIGRATALASARLGAELVLTDIRTEALDSVVDEIRRDGGVVRAHRAFDLGDIDAVRSFADEVHASVPSIDVLMNIAGASTWGPIERLEHHHWKKMIDVNLMGPIHTIECFIPRMVDAGRGGHLVNVSSAAGLLGLPWHAAYSASKFGLRGISEVARFDLARHGIGVSLVCPGAVKTPLVETLEIVGVDRSDPRVRKLVDGFKRYAVSPEHVADCILRGIRDDRYLVYTSPDIRLGHLLQDTFAWPYEQAMRFLNDRLYSVATRVR